MAFLIHPSRRIKKYITISFYYKLEARLLGQPLNPKQQYLLVLDGKSTVHISLEAFYFDYYQQKKESSELATRKTRIGCVTFGRSQR